MMQAMHLMIRIPHFPPMLWFVTFARAIKFNWLVQPNEFGFKWQKNVMQRLTRLVHLDLSENEIETIPRRAFAGPNLQILILSPCPSTKLFRPRSAWFPGSEPQQVDRAGCEPLRWVAQPLLPRARLQQDCQDRQGCLQRPGKWERKTWEKLYNWYFWRR